MYCNRLYSSSSAWVSMHGLLFIICSSWNEKQGENLGISFSSHECSKTHRHHLIFRFAFELPRSKQGPNAVLFSFYRLTHIQNGWMQVFLQVARVKIASRARNGIFSHIWHQLLCWTISTSNETTKAIKSNRVEVQVLPRFAHAQCVHINGGESINVARRRKHII